MKNIRKTMSHLLLLGLTVGCGFFAVSQTNREMTANYAEGEDSSKLKTERQYTAEDFTSEEQADQNELDASIVQSAITNTSQSLNISFRSKTLNGFKTGRGGTCIATITDPNYTGDKDNPVSEDYTNYNEDGLPILEGAISFVTGSVKNTIKDGGNQKEVREVFIPSEITQDGAFVIKVTRILANCITANGEEYNGSNKWYNGDALKIDNIYIPNTIEHVDANAFTSVPDAVSIHYEGSELSSTVFENGWTDTENIVLNSYRIKSLKQVGSTGVVDDMKDELGRPVNFILGCKQDKNHQGAEYDRPLVIQYDKVTASGRRTIYEALPLTNTVDNPYDSVGKISSLSYSRLLGYKLEAGESIDDSSIVFHNIMKASDNATIDTSKTYWVKPSIGYSEKQKLDNLLTFKETGSSTFGNYSMFTLSMDKNLSITSEKYPQPHSLYLDVKTDIYEQNLLKIKEGSTVIRYSLYNLYLSSYHFVYERSNGEMVDFTMPISTVISYQTLDHNKNNKVSVLIDHSKVKELGKKEGKDYSDFSAEKVRTFELVNITVQMDLFTTSDSGSTSVLGKSAISYKFAYITVRDNAKKSVFNYNVFLVIFFVGYAALFAAGAFALYKVLKEKYKNDEFRRVNDKKYLKKAILYGLGSLVIAAAIVFISMRVGGFATTIVVFNPTDPLLIAFSIAGLIIAGYFIVQIIKAIKAEKERRKAIRLKLNEDVDDDGTK